MFMTEEVLHSPIHHVPDSKKHDQSHLDGALIISGEESVDLFGTTCHWELRTSPDFEESDRNASSELLMIFGPMLKEIGVECCLLQVSDGSPEEEVPHYILSANVGGNGDSSKSVGFSIDYEQSADGGSPEAGTIKVVAGLPGDSKRDPIDIATQLFVIYDAMMKKHYPDYVIDFKDNVLQLHED
jgi:hypothetical protein